MVWMRHVAARGSSLEPRHRTPRLDISDEKLYAVLERLSETGLARQKKWFL